MVVAGALAPLARGKGSSLHGLFRHPITAMS